MSAQTDTRPFDIAVGGDNRHLSVVNSGAGTLSGYRPLQNGTRADLGATGKVLPAGTNDFVVI